MGLQHGIGVLVQTVVAGGVGAVAYALLAALFRLDEASLITTGIERFWRLVRSGNGVSQTPTA